MSKRILALLITSLLLLAGLIWIANPSELLPILRSSSITMVALSIASYTLAIILFAHIWLILLKATGLRLSFIDNQKLVFSSVFFNIVTPTASYGGEAVRTYLLSRRFNQDTGRGVATIVAHRIIGTISNSFCTLLIGLYLIILHTIPPLLLLLILIVTLASFLGFLIFLYLGLRIEQSRKLVEKAFKVISRFRVVQERTRSSVHSTLESYHSGLEILLSRKSTLLASLALGIAAWFLVNLVAVFAYKAVGGAITTANFLLIFTFFAVARLIPTGLPEFVGSKEAILAGLYSFSGLPPSISVAVIILIRVATQAWMILLGGAVTLKLGLEGLEKR